MQDPIFETLLESVRAGNLEESYALWQALRPVWTNWERKTHLPGLDRDDLRQQSYLILLESLDKYEPDTGLSFHAYYKVRLHIWRRRVAKRCTPINSSQPGIEELIESQVDDTDTYQTVEHRMLEESLGHFIQTLDPLDRQLMNALLVQEQNATQLSATLGLTPANIRYRKKKLLDEFKKHC